MTGKPEAEQGEAQQCFMCEQYKPSGCLECRTHRLLSDIREGLYDKMGVDQNRTEWEERALKAEAEGATHLALIKRLAGALKHARGALVRHGMVAGELYDATAEALEAVPKEYLK